MCLMKPAMALQRSDVQLPDTWNVNIFLHSSASHPDGPDLRLVLIDTFVTNDSLMSSKIIG